MWTIAVLRADDLDEQTRRRLVALLNEAFERHRWLFPGDRTTYEQFVEETAGSEVLVLVEERAEDGRHDMGAVLNAASNKERTMAGMAVIHAEGEALYIGMVGVAPALQGKGYAGQLLRAAEGLARERGLRAITLTTVPELGNAIYWQRHGFVVTAEEPRPAGTWGALAPHTVVWMEKQLD